MRQLSVVSGKGGTGKTTVTASLVALARGDSAGAPVVSADCDVDAANLALLLPGEDGPARPFEAGQRAAVDPALCNGCGLCLEHCRFGALDLDDEGGARVDPLACEGCAVCAAVCPEEAVRLRPNLAGALLVRRTEAGPLVHARLGVAQDNSGKLVAAVRVEARAQAEAVGAELVVADGPPGIGCPVHAAVTGADLLVAVTEPTPSGVHDLGRLLELCRGFSLRAAVLVNKVDLSPRYAEAAAGLAREHDAPLLGALPFDPAVPRLLAKKQIPLTLPAWRAPLEQAWQQIRTLLAG